MLTCAGAPRPGWPAGGVSGAPPLDRALQQKAARAGEPQLQPRPAVMSRLERQLAAHTGPGVGRVPAALLAPAFSVQTCGAISCLLFVRCPCGRARRRSSGASATLWTAPTARTRGEFGFVATDAYSANGAVIRLMGCVSPPGRVVIRAHHPAAQQEERLQREGLILSLYLLVLSDATHNLFPHAASCGARRRSGWSGSGARRRKRRSGSGRLRRRSAR